MLKLIILTVFLQSSIVLSENLKLLAKIRSSYLEKYEDYINSVIFHINIPPETVLASFQFTAGEVDLSIFGCRPRNVSLYMKWGSPPVINPDGAKFPPTFYPISQSRIRNLEFQTDKELNYINITSPSPGLYFIATFLSYTNPKFNAISQKGLSPHCMPFVDMEINVNVQKTVDVIGFNETVRVTNNVLYKFYVEDGLSEVLLTVNRGNGLNFTIQADRIPTVDDYLIKKDIFSNKIDEEIVIPTITEKWHYLMVEPMLNYADIQLTPIQNEKAYKLFQLIRVSNSESFTYSFELSPENGRHIVLNSTQFVVLRFKITDTADVGGSLQYSLAVKSPFAHKIIGTLSPNEILKPKWPSGAIVLNRTHTNGTIHIPYPETSIYYASFKLFCDTKTNCSQNVSFDLISQPCLNGDCNERGRCVFLVSSGFVYSACSCVDRYRGWTCADATQVISNGFILLELLLLVLSNLAFLPCVYISYKRGYYVEALCFLAICFFSTFYHACDAGEHLYSFCLTKLSALMFADFFCALLTFWVILLAMADLKSITIQQILQVSGAIILSFCTMVDKMSLWIFFVPTLTGLMIITVCWYLKYRKNNNQLFINKRYYMVNLPAGGILLAIGLTIYTTLQTEDNYKYLHSMWHIIMAVSAIILLPNRNTFLPNTRI